MTHINFPNWRLGNQFEDLLNRRINLNNWPYYTGGHWTSDSTSDSAFPLEQPWGKEATYHSPSTLLRNGDDFILRVPCPGFNKDEIDIQVSKNHINITCEKKPQEQLPEFKLVRGYLSNALSFKEPIPGSINQETIDASLVNGILQLTFSIAAKKELSNKIKIK